MLFVSIFFPTAKPLVSVLFNCYIFKSLVASSIWQRVSGKQQFFCRFLSFHIPVKWPSVQTLFKAGSQVYRQHLGSHSPLLSPNFLLTLNSNVTWLHDETLLFLCTHQWCGSAIPHYLILSRAADRNALDTPAERELGNARNFPGFSPCFFASFHPRGRKWEDLQTCTQEFYLVVCGLVSAVPCSLSTGLDGPQALLSLCEHGWRGLDYTAQSY